MENNETAAAEQAKAVKTAYTVYCYDDESVDVKNVEGYTPLKDNEIFESIEKVSRMINLKRTENAARLGAREGIEDFYRQVAAAQEAEKQQESK